MLQSFITHKFTERIKLLKSRTAKTLKLENINPWFGWDYSLTVQVNHTDSALLASVSAVLSFLGVLKVKKGIMK